MATETTGAQVANAVRSILSDVLSIEAERVTDNATVQHLGGDNLDVCDVLSAISDEFGVLVDVPLDANTLTVGAIIEATRAAALGPA